MGTALKMPLKKDKDKDTERIVRPIRFCLDEVLAEYNSTRPEEDQLSINKLNQIVDLKSTTTWRHRTGRSQGIDWTTLAKYCEALDCTPGDLLYYESGTISLSTDRSSDKSELPEEQSASPRPWGRVLKEINTKTGLNISHPTMVAFLANKTEDIPLYIINLFKAGQEGKLDQYLKKHPVDKYLKGKAAH